MKKYVFFSAVFCVSSFVNTVFAQDSSTQNIYTLSQQPKIYKGCEQTIFIPFENPEKIKIKISEGEIKTTNETNVFIIRTPKNISNINVIMENDEKLAKNIPIKLYPVPAPDVYIGNQNGERINAKFPITIEKEQKIIVYAKTDETFKDYAPKDANFKVKTIRVSQFRNGRMISSYPIEGNVFETDKITDLQTEDGIQIEITKVVRINYKGEEESAPIKSPLQSFYVGDVIGR